MTLVFSSLSRALANCLHGKVIAWTLFPLALLGVLAALLGWFYWSPALASLMAWLRSYDWFQVLAASLQSTGQQWSLNLLDASAAILLLLAVAALLIVLVLLVVSVVMSPQLIQWVAQRRFAHLERKHGASLLQSVVWAVGATAMALAALVVSMPLWLIPPLVLVLPPLIWGWLTYRVMAFDALSEHASKEERQTLFVRYRAQLLLMGVVCGLLSAAPSIVWASGVVFVIFAWILVPLAIWIYAFVLALSSLWFAHFCLGALQQLRQERGQLSL